MFDPKQLFDLMQKAKDMEAQMKKRLDTQMIKGEAGAGLVKVEMNGNLEVLSTKIDPSLLKESEQEFLQDLLKAALNDALSKSKGLLAQELKQMGLNLGNE